MTYTLFGDATCTEQGPWPHPLVGHVTGDMKRRESNETQNGIRACTCAKGTRPRVQSHVSMLAVFESLWLDIQRVQRYASDQCMPAQ